jgi:hypothetical protein
MAQTLHNTASTATVPAKEHPDARPLPPRFVNWSVWVILAIAMLLAVYVRGRLREFPLERDEGEFAYAGQLLLEGVPPYQLAYNMKLPGTYLAYAGLMAIFGQTTAGIHLGLLLVNLATIVLLFLMVREMFDPFSAAVAALAYSLMSMSPAVLGMAGHATHFVAFFGLLGTWLLWRAVQSGRALAAFGGGALLGTAFLMKQQGVFLLCFGGLMVLLYFLWLKRLAWRKALLACGLYGLGGVLPYAAVCLWLWYAGVFEKFWFWTFTYAQQYVDQMPLIPAIVQLFWPNVQRVVAPSWPLWLLALGGLIAVAVWGDRKAGRRCFVCSYLLFSFLCVCPGLYFREHYFIVMLPPVALLAGVGAGALLRLALRKPSPTMAAKAPGPPTPARRARSPRNKPAYALDTPQIAWTGFLLFAVMLVVAICAIYPLWQQQAFCFSWTPEEACRITYGPNPFLECPVIAEYLKAHTEPDQTVAVVGSEPEVYFHAKRTSATGYIYTYGLMEEQPLAEQMQHEMIDEIEKAKPAYMVFINVQTSWLPRPRSKFDIIHWAENYLRSSYQPVGVVDILYNEAGSYVGTEYKWDDDALHYQIRSPFFLSVWKRKT